jgi:ech hydrogenase subunit D
MAERKDLIQDITVIDAGDLLETASDIKTAGYRLGQACATKVDGGIEVLYTFEQGEVLKNYKILLPEDVPVLQSVTSLFWSAFIYENEMHDLFGITFKNLALDYGGSFFKIAKKTPWNPGLADVALPDLTLPDLPGSDVPGSDLLTPGEPNRLSGGRPRKDSTRVAESDNGLGPSRRTPCEPTPPETDSVPRASGDLTGQDTGAGVDDAKVAGATGDLAPQDTGAWVDDAKGGSCNG